MKMAQNKTSHLHLYHILLRGRVQQPLFLHTSDYHQFIEYLLMKQRQFGFRILGYCMVNDQVQLIIEERCRGTLASSIHGLTLLYTRYYKNKYEWDGPIFSGTYQCEPIHLNKDLLCRLRHIHQKPKRLDLPGRLHYTYSSYKDYTHPTEPSFVYRHFVYQLFDTTNNETAARFFMTIHQEMEPTNFFEVKDELYKRVKTAKRILKEEILQYDVSYDQLQKSSPIRDQLILRIYQESDLNQQEIADLLSISRHIVGRIIRLSRPC